MTNEFTCKFCERPFEGPSYCGYEGGSSCVSIAMEKWRQRSVDSEARGYAAGVAAERTRAEVEIARVRALIDRDRTGLAAALGACRDAAKGRAWIAEGRGAYRYDDNRYREETGHLIAEIRRLAEDALSASGTLANEAFHPPKETT